MALLHVLTYHPRVPVLSRHHQQRLPPIVTALGRAPRTRQPLLLRLGRERLESSLETVLGEGHMEIGL